MAQLTYEQKKEKFINTLNNNLGFRNVFTEVTNISDEDLKKIIELYEKKASVGGKDPWHYLYFDELIIMQQAIYEVVKDDYGYSDVTAKVEKLFEKELDRRLRRIVRSYGEETDATYKASYAEMPEYAMTLADMCVKNMVPDKYTFEEKERAIDKYQQIREDFIKAGKKMPMQYETTLEYAQGQMARRNVGGTPKELPIEPVMGVENIREANLRELREIQERKIETPVHMESEKRNAEVEQQKNVAEVEQQKNYDGSQQTQISEKEQKKIYNLIHKEENDRLKRRRSLYTAWDLGNKTIPPEYQGMTYEQVEAILIQKEVAEKAMQEAKATRDELIGKAIRKDLNVPEDYHLSQIQIQNLSQQFVGYSDDELREFISDVKKQETAPDVKVEEVTQVNNNLNEETQQSDKLINDILSAMLNAGEFHNSGLDITQKMSDLEYVKSKLQTKSLEELEYILSAYAPRQEETMTSGGIKR